MGLIFSVQGSRFKVQGGERDLEHLNAEQWVGVPYLEREDSSDAVQRRKRTTD